MNTLLITKLLYQINLKKQKNECTINYLIIISNKILNKIQNI